MQHQSLTGLGGVHETVGRARLGCRRERFALNGSSLGASTTTRTDDLVLTRSWSLVAGAKRWLICHLHLPGGVTGLSNSPLGAIYGAVETTASATRLASRQASQPRQTCKGRVQGLILRHALSFARCIGTLQEINET
ncbi:hypothetical protein RHECIAT_CH0003092 [Rhizobium etli CIAT 652]|uniref:Uncharacterized protein n=1 Tax=Rhizobium etli (strain CIAT 652) TaxID=491916 RepID=B3PUF9_RHIE6|nr:hypothetical protein RHECIAT_CH0003092 [Rhizobium etli CIAT 652]